MRRTVVSLLAAAALTAGTASAAIFDGTFNYQGRLTSGGAPITGNADVRFSLWDAPAAGVQKGPTITFLGSPVTGGLFNSDLDFGVSSFTGDRRWLQIEVRSPAGVGGYVNLGRQEVLPAPYALQTRGIYVDPALNVGIGTTGPAAELHIGGTSPTLLVKDDASNVAVTLESIAGGGVVFPFGVSLENGGRSVRLDQNADLGQMLFDNASSGARTCLIGNAANSQSGVVELGGNNFVNTAALWADGDLNSADGIDRGLLTLRSFGGGEGGEASIHNDDGSETIELLGGASGGSGTLSMFDPTTGESTVSALTFNGSGGRISTLSEDGADQAYWEPDFNGEGVFVVWRRENFSNGMIFDGNNGSGGSTLQLNGTGSNMSFNTANTGSASVNLPSNAIQDTEILDEPGVASENLSSATMGTGAIVAMASRSITVPASGYVLVLAQGDIAVNHATGTSSGYNYGVSDSSTTLPSNQDILTLLPAALPSGIYDFSASAHGVFAVPSAGTYTYYFNADKLFGNTATMFDITLTLVYFPTAYGTVTPQLLARGDGSNDQSGPGMPGLTPADIRSEQLEAVAFDQNRRNGEATENARRIAELEAQLQAVLREQESMREELRRASPPRDNSGAALGAALGHNDADSR